MDNVETLLKLSEVIDTQAKNKDTDLTELSVKIQAQLNINSVISDILSIVLIDDVKSKIKELE